MNKSVSDTRPRIMQLPCCSTHTSRSARDEENFCTTDNSVSSGVQVWKVVVVMEEEEDEEEEEVEGAEEWRWPSSVRRGVSRVIGIWCMVN